MAKTTAANDTPATDAPVEVPTLEQVAAMSPLEQIAALKLIQKSLTAGASQAMADQATEVFKPLHEQVASAIDAIGDDENPERGAKAVKWVSDNFVAYRKAARDYHKAVHGVAAPRAPRKPSDDAEGDDSGE